MLTPFRDEARQRRNAQPLIAMQFASDLLEFVRACQAEAIFVRVLCSVIAGYTLRMQPLHLQTTLYTVPATVNGIAAPLLSFARSSAVAMI